MATQNLHYQTIFNHGIKSSKRIFKWNRIAKSVGKFSVYPVRITHNKNKKVCQLIMSRKLRKVYGGFTHANLLYSEGFLGIQFTNTPEPDSYKLTYGQAKRNEHFNATRILRKIKPRYYKEEKIEFDVSNKCLVIPVELIEPITHRDLDYKFSQDYDKPFEFANVENNKVRRDEA